MTASSLRERRVGYARALDKALYHIVDQLAQVPEAEKVVVFGSYAAGRCDLFTDLDLLVVMDTDQGFVHRTVELYRRICSEVDLDLLVYTPEEFERRRQSGFVRHALATGQVVYEKKLP